MTEVHIRSYSAKHGQAYQYRVEIASIDGKREWAAKGGFKTGKEALEAGRIAQEAYEKKISLYIKPALAHSCSWDIAADCAMPRYLR